MAQRLEGSGVMSGDSDLQRAMDVLEEVEEMSSYQRKKWKLARQKTKMLVRATLESVDDADVSSSDNVLQGGPEDAAHLRQIRLANGAGSPEYAAALKKLSENGGAKSEGY